MARQRLEQGQFAFQYVHFWKETWGKDKSDTYNIDLAALRQVNTATGMERKLRMVNMVIW